MSKPSLKPCPHCDGEAIVQEIEGNSSTWREYGCGACQIFGPDAEDWNRRAEPPCPPEVGRLVASAGGALKMLDWHYGEIARHHPDCTCAICGTRAELRAALAPFDPPRGEHAQLLEMTREWLAKGYRMEDFHE